MPCIFWISSKYIRNIERDFRRLDLVHKQIGQGKVSSKIISKLKNTMSDHHAAEKLFNELLADYRADILPEVMANWSNVS